MSQDVTNKPETSGIFSPSVSVEPWSVESDADRLMDELFSDIDRILEGGTKLPTEPVQPNYVSLQSVVVPPVVIPKIPQGGQLVPKIREEKPENPESNGLIREEKPKKSYLDKILFIISSVSLLGVVAWLVSQGKIVLPFALQLGQNVDHNSAAPGSDLDHQFVAYMQRSLELIDRKQEISQGNSEATTNSEAPVTLPPAPLPANTGNNSQGQGSVIERIYIPVYPPAATVEPTPQSIQPVSPVIPSPNLTLTPPPSIAVPPSLPKPSPPSSPVENNLESSLNLPVVKHTLVGLLESGENSAALFEIDGSSQRIRIGESIGSSGWTLVSVANQKAVIRRNGEVRSIYVGQEF